MSSPYAKYGKRPRRYSAHYMSWHRASTAGNENPQAAENAAEAHERQFHYRRNRGKERQA